MLTVLSILGLITLILIYFFEVAGEKTRRKSIKGKLKYLLGNVFYSFGKLNMKVGRWIAETKKEQEIRKAIELLTQYNQLLFFSYFPDGYTDKDRAIRHLHKWIDITKLKTALNLLDLSYERWQQVATKLYYWGIIVVLSRNEVGSYYSPKKAYVRNAKDHRADIINSKFYSVYKFGQDIEKVRTTLIKEALEYFGINEIEWIEYGDAVINMGNIDYEKDDRYLGNFNFNHLKRWEESEPISLMRYIDYQTEDEKI